MAMQEPELLPLGIFGGGPSITTSFADELESRREQMPVEERHAVAHYLRSGSMVMAWMEHTTDCLHGAFGVPGGSAIMTDGTYYWRLDAADYVETYGIGLPQEFLELVRRRKIAPPIAQDDLNGIYEALSLVFGMRGGEETSE